MHGLDGMDLQVTLGDACGGVEVAAKQLAHALRAGGVLAKARGEGLLNDYDPNLMVLCNPTTFPWGTGARPEGMSIANYTQVLLWRTPSSQFAANTMLQFDLFNTQQRHSTNTQAFVQKCITKSAGEWEAMGELQPEVVAAATQVLSHSHNHKSLNAALKQAPPAVRTLVQQARLVSRRVQGSPGSFASLRSRATAAWDAHGMWTMMLNFNPSELDSPVVFEMAGHEYTFDAAGRPKDRPSQADRWRIVASNPLAIAHFMELFMTAFVDVFLHWPLGAKQQEKRDQPCPFGDISAWFFKFESGGRGGIHVHGAVVQRALQPQVLDRLLSDPATRDNTLAFMEFLSQQFLPDPFWSKEIPLSTATSTTAAAAAAAATATAPAPTVATTATAAAPFPAGEFCCGEGGVVGA